MNKLDIFIFSFIGGLLYVLVALFLITSNSWAHGYLVGMGQIMVGVGLLGMGLTWLAKKKEAKEYESDRG